MINHMMVLRLLGLFAEHHYFLFSARVWAAIFCEG